MFIRSIGPFVMKGCFDTEFNGVMHIDGIEVEVFTCDQDSCNRSSTAVASTVSIIFVSIELFIKTSLLTN